MHRQLALEEVVGNPEGVTDSLRTMDWSYGTKRRRWRIAGKQGNFVQYNNSLQYFDTRQANVHFFL